MWKVFSMQTQYGCSMWHENVKVFCMQTLYGFIWYENAESILYADFVQFYLAWKCGKCSVRRLYMVVAGIKLWKMFCTQTLYVCFIWHENMENVLWAWKHGKCSVCRLWTVPLFGMKTWNVLCTQTVYGRSIWHESLESVLSSDSVQLFYLAWKWGKRSVGRLCMVALFGMNKQKQAETCSGCRLRMAVLLVMKMWKVFCVQTLYQVQGTVNRHQAQERVNRHHSREAVNDATVMLFPSPFVKSLQSGLYHWNSKHITHYHRVCSLVFTTETANTSHIYH